MVEGKNLKPATARFWRELKHRYRLLGSRCKACGSYFFPPRSVCPNCRRRGELEEYQFKGTGVVETYTVVHGGGAGKKHELSRRLPYVLAIVRLDEGVRVLGELACDPEGVRTGMRVRAAFRRLGEDGERGIIYYGTKFVPDWGCMSNG